MVKRRVAMVAPGGMYTGPELPRDLTTMTPEQREAVIEFFRAMPLRELRRRQDISFVQGKAAWEQGRLLVSGNEEINYRLLTEAIIRKEF